MVRNKSSLLIDEPPLQVLPTLAAAIGLNEAIFVQQLHWLLMHSGKTVKDQEGKWVYNTVTEWREKYPFWSERTIKRIIKDLKTKGVLRVGRFNKMAIDQTRWYSLDYDVLNTYSPIVTTWHYGEGQNGTMTLGQNDPMLPEIKNTNQRNGVTPLPPEPETPPTDSAAAPPKPLPPHSAVALNGTTENALWAALEKLNRGIKQRGGKPITGTRQIAARLAARGETIETMRAAWRACKDNAVNDIGAFVFWTREEYTPPPKKGFETKTDADGNRLVHVEGQGWEVVSY